MGLKLQVLLAHLRQRLHTRMAAETCPACSVLAVQGGPDALPAVQLGACIARLPYCGCILLISRMLQGQPTSGYAQPQGQYNSGYAQPQGQTNSGYAQPQGQANSGYAQPQGQYQQPGSSGPQKSRPGFADWSKDMGSWTMSKVQVRRVTHLAVCMYVCPVFAMCLTGQACWLRMPSEVESATSAFVDHVRSSLQRCD